MDWLDEKVEIVGRWLHNLSLRKALIAYIVICVISIIGVYAFTVFVCEKLEDQIWSGYTADQSGYMADDGLFSFNMLVYYQDTSILTGTERAFYHIIVFIKTWSILIYSIGGVIGVSLLFYRNKMKQPLQLLKDATAKVGDSDLDLELWYDSKDEMGDLCRSFDFMRKQLIMNNQKMWDMMEEQRRLNSAFAHDLRTPLTVLKGYTDFLGEYIPQGKVSEEKLLSTLSVMSEHIGRLERYTNTMKELQSFEELPVRQTSIAWEKLVEKTGELVKVFDGRNGIQALLTEVTEDCGSVLIDEAIFMEVFENLMSNALRYAKAQINVMMLLSRDEHQLQLIVADDGKGFKQQALSMATRPYYTDSPKGKSEHFGIGLYVCRLLCEKHGGWISLSNGMNGGAFISAAFDINRHGV